MEARISKDTRNIAQGLFDSECDLTDYWREAVDDESEDLVTGYFDHHEAESYGVNPDKVYWIEVPVLIGVKIANRDCETIMDREFCQKVLTPALVSEIEDAQLDAVNGF